MNVNACSGDELTFSFAPAREAISLPLRNERHDMEVVQIALSDVKLLKENVFKDERGYFTETYNARKMAAVGIDCHFVQDNLAHSIHCGTVRGLHLQIAPAAQAKLVRVIRGRILDVVVDLRRHSPTFGQHALFELSAGNHTQLLVPADFAHGYCTLEPNTEVAYKVDHFYAPALERGILWNDPELAIPWPVDSATATVSVRDQALPRWSEWRAD